MSSATDVNVIQEEPKISSTNQSRLQTIKCVVVGDGFSGKTSLLTVYIEGDFPEDHVPTVFETKCTEITVNNKNYVFMLVDTAGQEAYDRLRPLSYNHADIIIICYDVARPSSYESVTVQWVPETKHLCPNVPVLLVACKSDLRPKSNNQDEAMVSVSAKRSMSLIQRNRTITTEEGNKLAKTIDAVGFIECSAKLNENVSKVFTTAAQEAINKKSSRKPRRRCLLL